MLISIIIYEKQILSRVKGVKMAYGKVDFRDENEVEKLKKDMGALVKQARISNNIRQFDIVMKLDFRQARISDIENGKVEITVSELIKLSKILEKPIADLLLKR
jgi:ribosome-binding protein aMBF1 (putative translation factor)